MGALLFYIFQSTLCLVLLYFLFRMFFRTDTLFRTNRIVLLVGAACCTLLPFMQCNVSTTPMLQQPISIVRNILIPETENPKTTGDIHVEAVTVSATAESNKVMKEETGTEQIVWQPPFSISWSTFLGIFYISGAGIALLFFSLSTWRMWRLIHRYPGCSHKKYRLIVCPEKISSFSWGNTIVLSQEDYNQYTDAILLHEEIHLQYRHTLDLIGMEILIIFHWFNPAVWLLMRELREIHEYEADYGVLAHGIDATQYQLLLVRKSVGTRLYSMASGLTHSKLKNRINMMLRRRTNNWARLKLLLFVPVAAATLMAFALPEVKKTVEQVVKPESMKQTSSPQEEWELLEQFFARKKQDALKEQVSKAGKSGETHAVFINMRNQVMVDNERNPTTGWKENSDFIRTQLSALLKKGYQKATKNNSPFRPELTVHYDRGTQTGAATLYLATIKDVYLQLRKEVAKDKGLNEAALDKAFPILVTFAEPQTTKEATVKNRKTSLPIEVRLVHSNGTELKTLKNISINELKKEIIACKASAGDNLTVRFKVQPDMWIGIVKDVKEAIAEAYIEK